MEVLSSSDEEPSSSDEKQSSGPKPEEHEKRVVVRHTLAQKAHLEAMYKTGMNSCSKGRLPLLHKAASETGLTVEQVKV